MPKYISYIMSFLEVCFIGGGNQSYTEKTTLVVTGETSLKMPSEVIKAKDRQYNDKNNVTRRHSRNMCFFLYNFST
jgi:hypothetical protein